MMCMHDVGGPAVNARSYRACAPVKERSLGHASRFLGFPPSHTFGVLLYLLFVCDNELGGGTIEGESLGSKIYT